MYLKLNFRIMNKDRPLLSIVIATKNREYYCIETIKSILAMKSNEIQLTVADNSDTEKVKEFVSELSDSRIRYQYDNSSISSIENFNRCVSLADGEYLCMIGDDDSVLPVILDIVKWAKLNDIDSIVSTKIIDYFWPSDSSEKYKNGLLIMPVYEGSRTFLNAKEGLEKLIKSGFLAYQSYNLPRSYHGIIKKECIENVKRITGWYFGGLSPDIYSTVSLSCFVKKHCVIDYPFSIAGICPSSTTAQAIIGVHTGKLEDAPHFRHRGVYNWEAVIPQFYSVETIWSESGIKALKDLKREELLINFNSYRLYIYSIYINRKYIFLLSVNKTLSLCTDLGITKLTHSFLLFNALIKEAFMLISKKITVRNNNNKNSFIVSSDIKTLEEAKDRIYTNLPKLDLSTS
jgi:glycosyltransferase involved in cell wall biosynthesis